MGSFREWAHRLLGTVRPRRRDRELAAEAAERRGDMREEAMRAARIRAGGMSQAMEAVRDQRGLPSIDALLRDLRFGLRVLMKDPLIFLAVAALLIVVGFCACLIPARRAMRLDPATVLRYE